MTAPLENRITLVTGASRGIGHATVAELLKQGFAVFGSVRKTADAERLAGEFGRDFTPLLLDVTQEDQVRDAAAWVADKVGAEGLWGLVNNAGITADGLFIMMPDEDWNRVIDTTLKGFYNVTKPVLKKMLRNKRGSVVSISSVAGLVANRGQANYSAAKAGLIAASRSIAAEVARIGVRMNVVAPGLIETEMIKDAPIERIKDVIPMARIGKPEEVAKVVRFLCSDDASYITGQVISVNGGMF